MTAKEKAKDLVEAYIIFEFYTDSMREQMYNAIQCALIYVNGIIEEYTHRGTSQIWEHPRLEYWNEVKLELEKL